MLDQILKFIGSIIAFGGITWLITYNLGTAIASINEEECDEANEWKVRYHILLHHSLNYNSKRRIKMTIRKVPFFAYLPKICSHCGRVFIFEPYWKVPVAPAFFPRLS